MKVSTLLALLALLAVACSGFNYRKDIAQDYSLIAVGDRSDMALYYRDSTERVPATVVALGWDGAHVVARCAPVNAGNAECYYIVDRKKDGPHVDPRDCVLGPLDAEHFLGEKQLLRLPDFSWKLND